MSQKAAPSETATAEPEVEQNLDPIKEAQQRYEEEFKEQSPELEMLAFWGGLFTIAASKRLEVLNDLRNSFKQINNPNFEYQLLKVRDPRKFQLLSRHFSAVKNEVEKQRKSHQERGYAQVGIAPIKQFVEKIDFNTFDHKEQAFKLAHAVQNKINAGEIRGKIEKTAEICGLTPENRTRLARGIADWQRQNPGAHIDYYFQSFGQYFHLDQQLPADSKLEGRKKEKEIKKIAKKQQNELAEKGKITFKQLDTVRITTIKSNREQIITAQ